MTSYGDKCEERISVVLDRMASVVGDYKIDGEYEEEKKSIAEVHYLHQHSYRNWDRR